MALGRLNSRLSRKMVWRISTGRDSRWDGGRIEVSIARCSLLVGLLFICADGGLDDARSSCPLSYVHSGVIAEIPVIDGVVHGVPCICSPAGIC